jgi:hypothetical protein
MRPGDSILINASEAELLTSDAFQTIVPPDIASKIELTPNTKPGYYRLALPKVGRSVVDALAVFAQGDIGGREAIAAEHLAAAIEQRLSGR